MPSVEPNIGLELRALRSRPELRLRVRCSGRLSGSDGEASDCGSCHDHTVGEFEPRLRLSAVSAKPTSDPLPSSAFLSPCPSPAHTLSLSLAQNNKH